MDIVFKCGVCSSGMEILDNVLFGTCPGSVVPFDDVVTECVDMYTSFDTSTGGKFVLEEALVADNFTSDVLRPDKVETSSAAS